ncbi:His-rich protein BRANT [Bradyrhizobium japonicum]|uniref:His-rich protein BRANT n=1 Tax=Bradyrhizobium japonicum TaxID=375 RepID=UPI00040A4D0B|nr:hypothetical protein [Bradyrhizobium japonicum]
MLKTISAALLAASVLAAPAFAAEAGKTTTTAPAIKADQSQPKAATAVKPEAGFKADTKAADVKADAKMDGKPNAVNAHTNAAPDEHKTVGQHRHQDKQSQKPDVTKPAATDKRN